MFKFDWDVLSEEDERRAEEFLNEKFRALKRPDVVGQIHITDLSFGTTAPEMQLMDIRPLSTRTREGLADEFKTFSEEDMEIAVRVKYDGDASFKIHSEVVINFPAPGFSRLPFTLHVKRCQLEGTALIFHVNGQVFFSFDDDGSVGPLKDVTIGVRLLWVCHRCFLFF